MKNLLIAAFLIAYMGVTLPDAIRDAVTEKPITKVEREKIVPQDRQNKIKSTKKEWKKEETTDDRRQRNTK